MLLSPVAFKYVGKVEEGNVILGVPCRDLTEQDLESFPAHVLNSINEAEFFVAPKTAVKPTKSSSKGSSKSSGKTGDKKEA